MDKIGTCLKCGLLKKYCECPQFDMLIKLMLPTKKGANMCKFHKAWIGECENQEVNENGYCEEHSKEHNCICRVCGKQATHECAETNGGLVCGENLCDDCEDELSPLGTNTTRHCKKTDQKFSAWYERNPIEQKKLDADTFVAYSTGRIDGLRTAKFVGKGDVDMIDKFIDSTKEKMFNYIKENYPSAIAKKEEEKKDVVGTT